MSDPERARREWYGFVVARIPDWAGYLVTLIAMVLLTAVLDELRVLLPGVLLLIPYILVTMAVAYYFGLWPAVFSIVLSAFSQSYVYVPPVHTLWPFARNHGEWARFAFFIGGLVAAAWAMLSIRRLTTALRREIAEHVRAEGALRESEEDLARAQALAHIGSWRLDVRTNLLTWSDEAYRIFGVHKGTHLSYESFLSFVHPDDRKYVDESWNAALGGERYSVEHRIIAADGSVKWVRETAELETGTDGELLGGFGTVQDVTEPIRLRKQLEQDRERLSAMYGVAEIGTTTLSLQEAMRGIAVRVREAMRAHAVGIFTYNEEQAVFEGRTESNAPGLVGTRLNASVGAAAIIRRERRTLYFADAEHDTALQDPSLGERHIKAMLAVPLIARGRLVGILRVDEIEPREYSTEEVETLEILAARAALIIDNAQLLESLSTNYQLLQRALIPPSPPSVPGYNVTAAYLPGARGAEIGGDFYDVFLTEDVQLAIVIGDVTGKGVPSASLAATTRSTLRAFAYDTSSPGESLKHTNAVVCTEVQDASLFVTALAAVVDHHTGRVLYTNAGHPPPAVWHRESGEVGFLVYGDPPIGVVPTYDFAEHEIRLAARDKIIFYTDGLSEARHDGELFGLERIEAILREVGARSSDDVVSALVDAACDWSEQVLRDDMAIVVIECGG